MRCQIAFSFQSVQLGPRTRYEPVPRARTHAHAHRLFALICCRQGSAQQLQCRTCGGGFVHVDCDDNGSGRVPLSGWAVLLDDQVPHGCVCRYLAEGNWPASFSGTRWWHYIALLALSCVFAQSAGRCLPDAVLARTSPIGKLIHRLNKPARLCIHRARPLQTTRLSRRRCSSRPRSTTPT